MKHVLVLAATLTLTGPALAQDVQWIPHCGTPAQTIALSSAIKAKNLPLLKMLAEFGDCSIARRGEHKLTPLLVSKIIGNG